MLHQLIQYANEKGLTSEPGFKAKTIKWLLIFDAKGRFVSVQGDAKAPGIAIAKAANLTQMEMVAAGRGTRHFLIDSLDKVALFTKEDVDEKLTREHEFFVNLLREAAGVMPVLSEIAAVLDDTSQLETLRAQLTSLKAKPTDSASFAVSDVTTGKILVLAATSDWHDWWREYRVKLAGLRKGKTDDAPSDDKLCLLSGESTSPAATHPKIAGLSDVGGLSMGDALTSFDKDAFTSFGLEQGSNAPVSDDMAVAYTGALNDLLKTNCYRLAGVKLVYWYAGADLPSDFDPMKSIIDPSFGPEGDDEDEDEGPAPASPAQQAQAVDRAAHLIQAIERGEHPQLLQARFFAMTLSGNSGRVVVRDWMEGSFVDLSKAVKTWFEDLAINNLSGERRIAAPSFYRVLVSALPLLKTGQNRDNWIVPVIAQRQALWNAALHADTLIPRSLVERASIRHSNDVSAFVYARALTISHENSDNSQVQNTGQVINLLYARISLFKAYLLRINRKEHPMSDSVNTVEAYLNESHPKAAYHCGRLMAVLQMIQNEALGEVGTGVAQSFYAAAASRPVFAVPQLKTKTQHHLKKIEPFELRMEYQNLLSQIDGRIGDSIPRTFDLEDQCFFHLGYYQQLPFRPYKLPEKKHTTLTGEKVRSLSEVIVANLLTALGQTYVYEKRLHYRSDDGERFIIPDFTIERPGRMPLYIEHLGMMDNFTYRAEWGKKKIIYQQNGILISDDGGKNGTLLVTMPERRTIDCVALSQQIKAFI